MILSRLIILTQRTMQASGHTSVGLFTFLENGQKTTCDANCRALRAGQTVVGEY